MEKRIMALILASALTLGAVLTGCSTNTESSSPDHSSQPAGQEESSVPEESVPEDSSASEPAEHSEAPAESGESQAAPVTPESGSSEESVVYENPDTGPDMTAEELAEIERVRTAWALREYLEETVSAENYAYLNPGDGILTIGAIDEEAMRAAVDAYSGTPCREVIYQPAECSQAQVAALTEALVDQEYPDRTGASAVRNDGGSGEGILVFLYADDDNDADKIRSQVLRLAEEMDFPVEYITFERHGSLPPAGINPDT